LDYIRPVVHAADDGKSLERSLELSAWNAIQTIKGDGVVHDLLGKNPIWTLRPQHRERSTEMDQYLWSFRFSLQQLTNSATMGGGKTCLGQLPWTRIIGEKTAYWC
jgi:hypothetical protein